MADPDGTKLASTTSTATDHDRAGRGGRAGTIVVTVLVALALAWLGQVFIAFRATEVVDGQTVYAFGDMWGYDYEAYLNGARRLEETGSPYQAETLDGPYRPGPYGLYMYPPVLAVGLLPVAGWSIEDSSVAWYLAHVLALMAACAIMPISPRLRLAAFAMAAFSFAVAKDMALGNVSVLLLLPLAMTWRWLDRPIGAAALAVAMALRPVLGIVLLWQLLRRQWRAVAWTLGAGLVLVLATLPFSGVDGILDFVTVLRNMSAVSGVARNYDVASTLLAAGSDPVVATLGLLAGYVVAIGAILIGLRRDRELGFMITLTASLLLSPLLWDHYLALLLIPAAFLAQRWSPLAVALPLLTWLPPVLYVPLVLLTLVLLVLAPGSRRAASPAPATATRASRQPLTDEG